MHVGGLWRYPGKSLRGEALDEAVLTSDGVPGDRIVHVSRGHAPLTGRTRHALLTIPATTGADGEPLVDGYPRGEAIRLGRSSPPRPDPMPSSSAIEAR